MSEEQEQEWGSWGVVVKVVVKVVVMLTCLFGGVS